MPEPTDKEQKEWEEFCEWCGFEKQEQDTVSGLFGGYEWVDNRGDVIEIESITKDMNFLIKYALPKAIEILKAQVLDGEAIWARCELMRRWLREWNDKPEDPVEALYQVLNQVRKEMG